MRGLTNMPVSMWIGTLECVLLLNTYGCGSLFFLGGPTDTHLNVQEDKLATFPTNIRLLEDDSRENEPIIVIVPAKEELENDPKIIFWESPLLKTQEWAELGWKGMKRGGRLGGNLGFTIGKVFCLPLVIVGQCRGSCEGALPFALLCGGGVIGGTSVGWVMGGTIGSLSYFVEEETVRKGFELVKQNVVQAIWKQLISKGRRSRSDSLQEKIDKTRLNEKRETFEFGLDKRPFDGFIQITPLHLQLFQGQTDGPEELTLRINVKWIVSDALKATIMEEDIQVDKGPYTYDEWSDADGWLLKSNLDNAYGEIAEHIVSDLQLNPHFLHPKPPLVTEGGS